MRRKTCRSSPSSRHGTRSPRNARHIRSGRRGIRRGVAAAGIHQGTQWWTSYQPVSYKLRFQARHGSRIQKHDQAVQAVGVDIIADVVLNQTTGADVADGKQTGVAGTEYNGSTGDYRACHRTVSGRHHGLRLPQLLQEHLQLHQPAGSPGMPPELHVGLRLRERKGPGYSI